MNEHWNFKIWDYTTPNDKNKNKIGVPKPDWTDGRAKKIKMTKTKMTLWNSHNQLKRTRFNLSGRRIRKSADRQPPHSTWHDGHAVIIKCPWGNEQCGKSRNWGCVANIELGDHFCGGIGGIRYAVDDSYSQAKCVPWLAHLEVVLSGFIPVWGSWDWSWDVLVGDWAGTSATYAWNHLVS